jgi:hypothetical protein
LAALVGLLGLIFTATFSEISAYYKDRAQEIQSQRDDRAKAMQRKWELVFPLLTIFYNPWIQSAKYLANYLNEIKDSDPFSKDQASRVLFCVTLFFSVRLRMSLKAGGVPILANDGDAKATMKAYDAIKPTLDWKGSSSTRLDVSFLQEYFLEKETPDKPYLGSRFISDIDSAGAPRDLPRIRNEILAWLSRPRCENASKALNEFQSVFNQGINNLYVGWLDFHPVGKF